MSWSSPTNIGENFTKSANATSKVLTLTAGASVGDLVVVIHCVDNAGTTNNVDEGSITGISNSGTANTWNEIGERTGTSGSAQDGIASCMYWSQITSAMSASATITLTYSSTTNRDAHVMIAWKFTPTGTVSVEGTPLLTGKTPSGPDAMDVTTSNIECLRIRMWGAAGTNANETPTSSWTEMFDGATSGGGEASNVNMYAEYIVSTGTGQSSDPTGGTGVYPCAEIYAAFKEVSTPPPPFSRNNAMFPLL